MEDQEKKEKVADNYPVTITDSLKKQSFSISPFNRVKAKK